MDIKEHGNIKIVPIPVRFDAQTSREVERVLQEIIEQGTRTVLCNFTQTEYISSAGLRVLIAGSKSLTKSGGKLYLCSTSTFVNEILETAGLTNFLKVFESEEDAIKNLS